MLILILIDVQHLRKAVFSFEKGSDRQNHSSSGSLHLVKNLPSSTGGGRGEVPPPTPYGYLENPAIQPSYACASDINTVISELQITASKLFTWFDNNHMKANPEKSHLLLSSKTPKKAYFGGPLVEPSSTEKLLGI